MHLRKRVEVALALLAAAAAAATATVVLAPDEAPTFPLGELLLSILDEMPKVARHPSSTGIPERWDDTETPHTVRPLSNPKCPPFPNPYLPSCGDLLSCEDDKSCLDDNICCPTDCGEMKCTFPIIKGPPPPIPIEEEIIEDDFTTGPIEWDITTTPPPADEIIEDDFSTGLPEGWYIAGTMPPQTPPPRTADKVEDSSEIMMEFTTENVNASHPDGLYELVDLDWNRPVARKLFCPKLDPRTDICWENCDNCGVDQLCCPNACGGKECMDAVTDEHAPETEGPHVTEPPVETKSPEPAVSDGLERLREWLYANIPSCPAPEPEDPNGCLDMCNPWSSTLCPEGQMCCRSSCGRSRCLDVIDVKQSAQKDKEQYFWDMFAKNTIQQYEKKADNMI